MKVIDLAEHVRKKQEAEQGLDAVLDQLKARTASSIDTMTNEILSIDLQAGGGKAAKALDALANLVDALTLHYVADMRQHLETHADEYVCIPRKVWDKAQAADKEADDAGQS